MIRITKRGWNHILKHHTGAQFTRHRSKSKFYSNVDLIDLINKAAALPPISYKGNHLRIFDAGAFVGVPGPITGGDMSLDFAILDVDGSLLEMVSLEIDQHDDLIDLASELQLFRILRFHDYFEDVDTWPIELPGLLREVAVMRSTFKTANIRRFLLDLARLIELAIRRRQILYAVPD